MEPPKTAPELPGSDPVHEPQLVRLKRVPDPPATPAESAEDPDEPDVLNEHVEEPGDPDGVFERETLESMPKPKPEVLITAPKVKRRSRHPFLKALLILIIIAAAAVGAFYFGDKAAEKPTKKASTTTTTQTKKTVATATTKPYNSTPFALSFDYPTGWNVVETADKITATSPSMSLSAANGNTTGVAVLNIQNKQTAIPDYPAAGAIETIESAKLTYAKPSGVQRAQTYLSYLSYSSPTALDVLFITGDSGYQTGQQVPMSDITKGNPLVSVQFMTCFGTACAGKTPQPIPLKSSSWADLSAQGQIIKMLVSIVFN